MVSFKLDNISGGQIQVILEGEIKSSDQELLKFLTTLSKKHQSVILNLIGVKEADPEFFRHLADLIIRTPFKAVVNNQVLIAKCVQIGIPTFPTVKSAALSSLGDETIKQLSSQMRDLPILKTDAYGLAVYMSRLDATFPQLESMIKLNAGLCSQIIRLANSSYFLRPSKAETLQQAFVTLGFTNLRQLFLYNFYKSIAVLFKSQKEVIQHGQKCAVLAEFITKAAGASADECAKVRLGALLHDIGRQVLAYFFPAAYEKVFTQIARENKPANIAEFVVFGVDHQAVGAMVCHKWNFPPYLADAISDHHSLSVGSWNTMTLPIFCANNFLNEEAKIPFAPYFAKLDAYFALKGKRVPWKDVVGEFRRRLESQEDPFV